MQGWKSKDYKDLDGAMLVERRGSKRLTCFPGSVHESGERVRWDRDGDGIPNSRDRHPNNPYRP